MSPLCHFLCKNVTESLQLFVTGAPLPLPTANFYAAFLHLDILTPMNAVQTAAPSINRCQDFSGESFI